jgi:hypothetical protein
MKESCTIEKISWGNTDNVWKPTRLYTFNTYEEGKSFLLKEKEYQFSYMHRYNVTNTIENWK